MITFYLNKKGFTNALSQLSKLARSGKQKNPQLECVLSHDTIFLHIPGCSLQIPATSSDAGHFIIDLDNFLAILETFPVEDIQASLSGQTLTIDRSSFKVISRPVGEEQNKPIIDLPLNYTFVDLARLQRAGKYSEEDIKANGLEEKIKDAVLKTGNDKLSLIHI